MRAWAFSYNKWVRQRREIVVVENSGKLTEASLIEQTSLPGRKAELRQLLKALNLCCSGQGKAVLVTGDEGIGKSALIDAFLELAPQYHAQSFRVTCTPKTTAPLFFVSIVQALLGQAGQVVQQALDRINTHLAPLEFRWTQADLLKMISLVGLQSAVSHRDGLSQEIVLEAILRNMSFTKRMNPQVRQQLLPAVTELLSPRLTLAMSLMNPINAEVQHALDAVQQITGQSRSIPLLTTSLYEQTPEEDTSPLETVSTPLPDLLSNLLNFINQGMQNRSACMVLVIEAWENLARMDTEETQAVKHFLNEVLRQTVEQRNTRLMILVENRTGQDSYTLGGSLYQALRVKVLVPPLSAAVESQRLKAFLSQQKLAFEEPVITDIIKLCQGNPTWLTLMMHRIQPDNQLLSWESYQERYAVKTPEDMVEFLFTRLQLAFVRRETEFLHVLEALVTRYVDQPFFLQDVLTGLSGKMSVTSETVSDVITALKAQHFLVSTPKSGQYHFFTPFLRDFLVRKFRPKAQPLPTPDKVASLKKILPMAIESGELTLEKIHEIFSMTQAMSDESLLTFVEETLIESARDPNMNMAQKLVLLESLGMLATPDALMALLEMLSSHHPKLVEQGLTVLVPFVSRPQTGPLQQAMEQTLIDLLSQEDVAIKASTLKLLIQAPLHMEALLPYLVELMQDQNPELAQFALAAVIQKRIQTPEVFEALERTLQSAPEPAIFNWILKGLERFDTHEVVPVLSRFLETQSQSAVWVQALLFLANLDLDAAMPWLSEILMREKGDADQKLMLLKRLGIRPHPLREKLLIEFLSQPLTQDLRWMAIKSLGAIGQGQQALSVLQAQAQYCRSDEIVHKTLENATRQISERLMLMSAAMSKPPHYAPEPEEEDSKGSLIELVAVDL